MTSPTTLEISSSFAFAADSPTDCLLQFEVAVAPGQRIVSSAASVTDGITTNHVVADDGLGSRMWLTADGNVSVTYSAQMEITRQAAPLASLAAAAPHDLPGEAVKYLFDSRYCPAGRFGMYVDSEFGDTAGRANGGVRVEAIRAWIARHFSYTAGVSGPNTTGADSFIDRAGVCRDYAHVMVMLARASGIPARYVSCYGPDVSPQDFHAAAQVYLADGSGAGAWHLVDATGMARAEDTAIIGVGRDAADVSFLTSFGMVEFHSSAVEVVRA
ncbi:transglutaminase-like domain-containing protein [Pontixanthobacter sp.]|uniref:transglutaminase-like domain-containing protein n=1 Tax=Pontixanthobacter sp. TaxID=2792078 RepID=UPI003C7C3164